MPTTIADHMKTAATAATDATDTAADTAVDTSTDVETDTAPTGDADTEPEGGTDAAADTEPEATEPDRTPKLFMSPDAQKPVVKDKPKGPAQKAKMPDSVRSRIEAETRSKVEAEYQWAQGISKEEGATLRQLRELGNTNPVALIDRFVQSVAKSPVHRQQLFNYLEQLYTPKSAQADTDPMPQMDTPQGYSMEGVKALQEWNQRQVMKQVQAQMAPLLNEREMAQRSQQALQYVNQQADRTVTQISKRPGFQGNEAAIAKVYNEIARPWRNAGEENHPEYRDENALLLEAYYTVTQQKNLEQRQKQWAADQKKKAGIGVVNPGATNTGTTTQAKPKNFREYFQQNKDKLSK